MDPLAAWATALSAGFWGVTVTSYGHWCSSTRVVKRTLQILVSVPRINGETEERGLWVCFLNLCNSQLSSSKCVLLFVVHTHTDTSLCLI